MSIQNGSPIKALITKPAKMFPQISMALQMGLQISLMQKFMANFALNPFANSMHGFVLATLILPLEDFLADRARK
jgi:hypothetical protein